MWIIDFMESVIHNAPRTVSTITVTLSGLLQFYVPNVEQTTIWRLVIDRNSFVNMEANWSSVSLITKCLKSKTKVNWMKEGF